MSSQKPTEIPFDPSTTPAELSSSLTELESALSPLLSREWSTQLEALTPLERAKTDVMVAYTIVDLMWIYLKMKGVDPATHDVSPELERVRAYYAKIHKIEYPEDSENTKLTFPLLDGSSAVVSRVHSALPNTMRGPVDYLRALLRQVQRPAGDRR